MSYTLQTGLFLNSANVSAMTGWASAVGAALINCGWQQTNDTGQVQWTGLTITGWSQSGSNVTATYGSLAGNQLTVGRQIAFTATTYGGTYVITGVNATNSTAGTFTFTSTNLPTGTGTATLLAAVPSSAYVYEIWQPSDALQTGSTEFYLKLYFGYSTTQYGIGYQIGTGTNGTGTLTGLSAVLGEVYENNLTTIQDCLFSGDTNRFSMCFKRGPSNVAQMMVIERTHNSDGTDSSDGVSLLCAGQQIGGMCGFQTIAFVGGLGSGQSTTGYYLPNPDGYIAASATNCLGSTCGVSPFFPVYGKFGNPFLGVVSVRKADTVTGCVFSCLVYGTAHTYYVTDLGFNGSSSCPAYSYLGMRFD